MSISLVTTRERPDLAEATARWRWGAFFQDEGTSLEAVLDSARLTSACTGTMPRTWVLLEGDVPVGTASLTPEDLEERPDLTPWLAGVYVVPEARGRGHAGRLVTAVERGAAEADIPVLWLYTRLAERVYARGGWVTVERFQRSGHEHALMRRDLVGLPRDHTS